MENHCKCHTCKNTRMSKVDQYLLDDIRTILDHGVMDVNPRPKYEDGTPAHTCFVTHNTRSYDLNAGEFPICTLRPIAWKGAIKEMFWIFQDESNDLELLRNKYNNHVWDQWESKQYPGTSGHRYGHTVHRYDIFKKRILDDIIADPYGRYHICNLWQEEEFITGDGLKPCAYETIYSVRGDLLDMLLIQRSGDMLVASGAGHWNEVQYAALLMMVAKHVGKTPGKFTHVVANEQIYDRHLDNAAVLLTRESTSTTAKLVLNTDKTNFYDFTIDDFKAVDYNPDRELKKLSFELGI